MNIRQTSNKLHH